MKIGKKYKKQIDEWHLANLKEKYNKDKYTEFLNSISYIVKEGKDFNITTSNVDEEIANIAGPQLVVPVDNARYALNAANARWGSLYDALYGTDVIAGKIGNTFDEERAKKVITFVREFLDKVFTLATGSWKDVRKIEVVDEKLSLSLNDRKTFLKDENQFIGFNGDKSSLKSVLLKNNNLHFDIIINPENSIGKTDKASISDFIVESAISTIIDNEDSVTAVDGEDKVNCYRNWLGLMKGDLTAKIEKNGKKFVRKLNPNRSYKSKNGGKITLHGRALLLNRNVGHLMTNPAIILKDGSEIPEGIMDAFFFNIVRITRF